MVTVAILQPPRLDRRLLKGVAIATNPDVICQRFPQFRSYFYIVDRRGWCGPNTAETADVMLVEDSSFLPELRRRNKDKVVLDLAPADFVDTDVFRDLRSDPTYDGIQIARWSGFKRHWLLLHAAARLPDRRFLKFGHFARGGDDRELALFERLQKKWPDNVVNPYAFLKSNAGLPRQGREVNRHINSARLGILTSKAEGINRFKMECLAANRPMLVAADACAPVTKHVNEQTGVLFEPTAKGLADAIESVLADTTRFTPRDYVLKHTGKRLALEKLKTALAFLCRRDGAPFVYDRVEWDGRNQSQAWGEEVYRVLQRAVLACEQKANPAVGPTCTEQGSRSDREGLAKE